MLVCENLTLTTKFHQLILESKWMLVSNLKKFPWGIPEIFCLGWDGCTDGQPKDTMPVARAVAVRIEKNKYQNYICKAGELYWLAALTFSILSSHSLFWANSAMKAWCFSHFLWSFWVSSRLLSLAISIFSHTQSPSWGEEARRGDREKGQYWMGTITVKLLCINLISN